MCRVFVGNDKEPYTIHQELIVSSSHFFKGALRSNMMEKNGDVKLPTHKSSHFNIYYRWLYSGTLDDFNFKEPGTSLKLFELYFLGDMLLDERFRNQLIDKVVQALTAVAVVPLSYPDVNLVYKNTLKDDKLRQLMAHIWAYRAHSDPHWYENPDCDGSNGQYPSEFLWIVLRTLSSKPNPCPVSEYPWFKDVCQYHEHTNSPKCT